MSKKTNEIRILENALNVLMERAQDKMREATGLRAKLLNGGVGEIEVTKEWIEQFAEVHIDLGAAAAVMHVVHGLWEMFDIADPFAEFDDPDNEEQTHAEDGTGNSVQ